MRSQLTPLLAELTAFCIKRFNLPETWNVELNVSPRSKNISGGVRYVGMSIQPFINVGTKDRGTGKSYFSEYKRLEMSPVIGCAANLTDEQYWLLVLSHEIAHCVQYAIRDNVPTHLGQFESGHGRFFQAIYFIIRQEFTNPKLAGCLLGRDAQREISKITTAKEYQPTGTNHELVGKEFKHPVHGASKIIEFKPRNRQYPVIFKTAGGLLVKTSVAQANRYLA